MGPRTVRRCALWAGLSGLRDCTILAGPEKRCASQPTTLLASAAGFRENGTFSQTGPAFCRGAAQRAGQRARPAADRGRRQTMNLHEYQAKEVFRSYGIPVPTGRVATSAAEAAAAAQALGGAVWVVKAQVHAGGRGKAGGVKVAKDLEAVRSAAA